MDYITYPGTKFCLDTPRRDSKYFREKFAEEYGDTYPSLSILVPLG